MRIRLTSILITCLLLQGTQLTTPTDHSDSDCIGGLGSYTRPRRQIDIDSLNGEKVKYIRSDSILGSGTFCTVYKGELHRLCEGSDSVGVLPVAIRVLQKENHLIKRSVQDAEVRDELMVHKLVSGGNEFILNLMDFFEDDHFYYFMLEYVDGGDLSARMFKPPRFDENKIGDIFDQIVKGVDFLHKNRVLHRDLKLDNILFTEINDGIQIKVADFGFAMMLNGEYLDTPLCGTMMYLAPETLAGRIYSFKSDIFAMGVMLYKMFMGQPPAGSGMLVPFPSELESKLRRNGVSQKYIRLILGMLARDPVDRFSIDDILKAQPTDVIYPGIQHQYRATGVMLDDGYYQVQLYDKYIEESNAPFYATTMTSIAGLPDDEISKLYSQIGLHSHTRHVNILEPIETFLFDDTLFLVTQWIDGGILLAGKLRRLAISGTDKRKLTEDQARSIFQEIVNGLAYLHEDAHLSHGNLSIESVVVAEDGDSQILVKLANFRSVELVGETGEKARQKDIYSLGKILLTLVCEWFPGISELPTPIPIGKLLRLMTNASPSVGVQSLITKIFKNQDSDNRITLSVIRNHPWIKGTTIRNNEGDSLK